MNDRENAVGVVLLLLCAIVAGVMIYGLATGTRFRLDGPSWLGPALMVFFIGASIYGFVTRTGRRWPWDRDDR